MAARDPYRNFRYEVEIDGFVRAGFSKVSGLKHDVEVAEYREGGDNDTVRKLPGQSKFEAVTFERGMSGDSDFVRWIESIFDLDARDGQGPEDTVRRTVVVYLKDKAGVRVVKWTIRNSWPSSHEAGDLDASASDVLTEKLVLQNEGIKTEKIA